MRGRGRGRLKDCSSPSPSPGNSHGSGDNDGRWSHNMYNSESDTTMQAGTYDKTKAVQGSRHQSPGMACQLNELRSSPIGRQINNNDTRTTSPASGDSDTPNRTRKPERSKNRRPDVQVYVPRARRQQMGKSRPENQAEKDRPELSTRNKHQTGQSGGAESQTSFENQEESSRTDQQVPSDRQLRQKKKEMENHVARGRCKQTSKDKDELQIMDPYSNVQYVSSTSIDSPSNIHKKIKIADNVSDVSGMIEKNSCSMNSFSNNEVEAVYKENSLKSPEDICGEFQSADKNKLESQNISKYKHLQVDTHESEELCASQNDNIGVHNEYSHELNTLCEDKISQKIDNFSENSTFSEEPIRSTQASDAILNIPSRTGETNTSDKSSESKGLDNTDMPESQDVYLQSKKLPEDTVRNSSHVAEDSVENNSENSMKTTVYTEGTSALVIAKATVSNSHLKDFDVGKKLHPEMDPGNDGVKQIGNNTNKITDSEAENNSEQCSTDIVEFPEGHVEPEKSHLGVNDVSSESYTPNTDGAFSLENMEISEIYTEARSTTKLSTESAKSDFDQLDEDSFRTKNVDKLETSEVDGGSKQVDGSNNIDSDQKECVRDVGMEESATQPAELMDFNESCEVNTTEMSEEAKGLDINEQNGNQSNDSAKMNKSEDEVMKTEDQSDVTIDSSQSKEEEADEDSWDTMFDDDGECLDPSAMEELTKKVGKVKIQKSKKINYLEYQPKDKSNFDFTQYEHIIEIYDFPAEFVTRDLIIAFQAFMSRGFDLKWVDDTHALGIFSSAIAAGDALRTVHPLLKVCPLSQASKQSQMKAKRCTEFLQPYKPRPETSAAAARRLVAGALGIATAVSKEKREKERQQLKEAKAKRRQEKQNRENIWEYGRCAMDEES